eukprot:COSAG01_NODE_94_length_26962_cov_9.110933_12_plen_125_part_00
MVSSVEDTGRRGLFDSPGLEFGLVDQLRLVGVPVVVYDTLAMLHTISRHKCSHQWVRHVAMSLHDAATAVCLLTGLSPPPPRCPKPELVAPGRVVTLGISGSSRGGKVSRFLHAVSPHRPRACG